MAEAKKEKKILIRMITNVRHGKKKILTGTLVKAPEGLALEWIKDGAAEKFDEEEIKIMEL